MPLPALLACLLAAPAGPTARAAPPGPAAPFSASAGGGRLALRLTGTFTAGPHTLEFSYSNVLDSAPLGSGTFQALAAGGEIELSAPLEASPGVYRIGAEIDGTPFSSVDVCVPGIERTGGDLSINGQPFSGFMWTWMQIDHVMTKDGGRFANINVDNLMRPVPEGGFGFNCLFTDSMGGQLKPQDFAYLDRVGGHILVQAAGWEGLNPWGPRPWNAGFTPDPILLSDGTPEIHGSFDSPKNRGQFVKDLEIFKSVYGSPPALLGFYIFESTPDMPWDNRNLYSDYSPASKARFRQWLAARFGSVAEFNAKRHGSLASFAAAEPPASPQDAAARGFDPAYWNDWIDFRYWDMADFLAWARGRIKAVFGPEKMLVTIEGLTSSYSSNDPGVPGSNSEYAIDERQRARATDAIGVEGTYDYMPNHVRVMRAATDFNGKGLPAIPIIMDYYNYSWQPQGLIGEPAEIPRLRFVDELGEGATGGMLEHTGNWLVRWEQGDPRIPAAMLDGFRQIGAVNDLRSRFPALFAQARVPHDISIVIPVWQLRYDSRYRVEARRAEYSQAALQHALQRSQRQIRMLYADQPIPADADALMVPTGYRISPGFIARLAAAVRQGARVYIEGTPVMDETGHPIPFPLGELAGASVALESGTGFRSLDGAWLPCEDTRKLENVTGEVLARFPDGAPAVVSHPYYKGEVIYSPSLIGSAAAVSAWRGALFELNFPEPARAYYQEIARMLSDPIVRISGASAPAEIRPHILEGAFTKLLLVTNWSAQPQDFQVSLRFPAGAAEDVRAGKPLPITAADGETSLRLHMDAHDWAAVALAATPGELEAGLKNPKAAFALGTR